MSSEDKTVEPSDQGPSLPPSSTGATSTGSPAQTDKRPRGRPRKDAATVTTQALPTATSKTRKKGRTRGRVVVDEEDSMDGTEVAESVGLQDTETKELPGERAEELGEDATRPPGPASREPRHSDGLCTFCYCGGRSLLGQGDLRAFRAPPAPDPPLSCEDGGGSADDGSKDEHSGGNCDRSIKPNAPTEISLGQGTQNGAGSQGADPDPGSRFWDELAHVGLPDHLDVRSLVDESGQCWAHQRCALWSDSVCKEGEGQSLLNVDRAIDSGSTKHCAYCKRLGASIKCCAESCTRLYHYPCAGAAGTFQDIRSLSLLCPEHLQLALNRFPEEAICALCDSPGDLADQLFCTSCGQHYHGMCLDMAVTPLRRAGWQCPECKICQTCKNPGEDTKMLVCDVCDKGYHTFCLQPAMDSIPTNGWRCKNCRVCVQCGSRTSGQWHPASLLCESCVQHQDPALCCPLCACVLDPEHHKDVLCCHTCKRWLHLECERQNSGQADVHPREDYTCSSCRPGIPELPPQAEDEVPMDTGPELSLQPALTHTRLSDSSPQLSQADMDLHTSPHPPPPSPPPLPPPMHSDPEQEPQSVPTHTEPNPVQAIVICETSQEGRSQAKTDQQLVSGEVDGDGGAKEVPVNKDTTKALSEIPPVGENVEKLDQPMPTQLSVRPEQPQDTTGPTKPAETETHSVQLSTKEVKAIISPTKEAATGPLTVKDEPMDVWPSGPLSAALETAPKEARERRRGEHVPGSLAERAESPEAVEDMDTSLESKSGLFHLSPSSSDHKPLKASLDRLAEMAASPTHSSPLAMGTSPREPPHPHGLPGQGEHTGLVTSTTHIPLTPKIGMGKPAITKRKFSPGRPRVKQGAWSPHSSVSSPSSWSPDQPEGWDVPKTRQPSSSSPGWSIRVVNTP